MSANRKAAGYLRAGCATSLGDEVKLLVELYCLFYAKCSGAGFDLAFAVF